ncbi:MAG TPA: alpha/beta hydrolase domain-containing protein [Acidobacteriota bacterium]|nr:alpha/beta hydrolase domain-containing protein [Acidobacteriota bacterium]
MKASAIACIQLVLLVSTSVAYGEVVGVEVIAVESPTFDGSAFGAAGRYEKIALRVTMEVDPEDPHNAEIVDLALPRRDAEGRVRYTTTVVIFKPIDLARGNGRIFYDVLNRGRKIGLGLMNDAPRVNDPSSAEHAGNGFLMREGYTVVWSGWQPDAPPGDSRMFLEAPMLPGIEGLSREEFIFDHDRNPAVATLNYPSATLDPGDAQLTVRQYAHDIRQTPPDLSFRYLPITRGGTFFTSAEQILVERPAGFDAGAIYEIVYTARDAVVAGLAFASVRDVVSFLRHAVADDAGIPNPLAPGGIPRIERAYALGISQSGRFLRDLLYQGFNEDEAGRVVFDGIIPDVAGARRTFINRRLAQAGRFSRQHESHLQPGDQFPFTYGTLTDSVTGKRDGVMARCEAAGNCPKVMHVDSSTEFFQGRSSLIVTDTAGEPLELPENVRAYLISSTPHSNSFGVQPGPVANCQLPSNPLHRGGPARALLVALDGWVSNGTLPPESRFPSRSDGTLVPPGQAALSYPRIPGVGYDGQINQVHVVDYGALPPTEGAPYPVFVPAVDEDGHDLAGIRMPAVEVPLATYMGWNLRSPGYAEGALCSVTGSTIALPHAKAERLAKGDPRLSLEERYSSSDDYIGQVSMAAMQLVQQRLLLAEDAQRYVERARAVVSGH